VDQVVAIAGQEAQGEVGVIELPGGRQVAAEAQAVGDDPGIAGVGLVQVDVGPLEAFGHAGVERVEREGPLLQVGVLAEGLEEVEPVPAGRFGGDGQGIEVARGHDLRDLADEFLGAGQVVGHAEPWRDLDALAVHHRDSVALAVDVHAHQERIGHGTPPTRF